jgi:hypothetical protein
MRPAAALAALLVLPTLASLAAPSHAAWPLGPESALDVVPSATGTETGHVAVTDGAGGAFVAWLDSRVGGHYDIYVQHVLATGVLDPLWPESGAPACLHDFNKGGVALARDVGGGVFVAWHDYRNGAESDLFLQRLGQDGLPAPGWSVDGNALCTVSGHQLSPVLAVDGLGGVYAVWYDARTGASGVYAQHVLATGLLHAGWPANGQKLCSPGVSSANPAVVADGAGGAFAAWGPFDVHAMRIRPDGPDPTWPAACAPVCTATGNQSTPGMQPDSLGGVYLVWVDYRNGTTSDLYMQHVDSTGAMLWSASGEPLCTAAGNQYVGPPSPEPAGDLKVAWQDYRNGTADIYVQRVIWGYPEWTWDGVPVAAGLLDQIYPSVVRDHAGGAIVSFVDKREGSGIAKAHRVGAAGALDPGWPALGVPLHVTQGTISSPIPLPDGRGGAVVVWGRYASPYSNLWAQRAIDGVAGDPEPSIVAVRDVRGDQGGRLRVYWQRSPGDVAHGGGVARYSVWRRVTPAAWEHLATVPARAVEGYAYVLSTRGDSTWSGLPWEVLRVAAEDTLHHETYFSAPDSGYSVDDLTPSAPAGLVAVRDGDRLRVTWQPNSEPDLAGYRVYLADSPERAREPAALVATLEGATWSGVAPVPAFVRVAAIDRHGNQGESATAAPDGDLAPPASRRLSFARPAPNPAGGPVTLRFALPRASSVRLEVFDPSGRRIRLLFEGERRAGEHALAWDGLDDRGRRVSEGLYVVRLAACGEARAHRFVVLR